MNRLSRLLTLGMSLALFGALLPVFVSASTRAAAPPEPQGILPNLAAQPLACADSPWGRAVEVGREQEIYLSSRTMPSNGKLVYQEFDLNGSDELRFEFAGEFNVAVNGSTAPANRNRTTAGTGIDLNGDGKTEFVQTFVNDQEIMTLVAYGFGHQDKWHSPVRTGADWLALAGGNIDGSPDLKEEAFLAFYDPASGGIDVIPFFGSGDGGIAPDDRQYNGWWVGKSNGRDQVSHVAVATGDINGNGKDNAVVAFIDKQRHLQIVALEYDSTVDQEDNSEVWRLKMKEVASFEEEAPSMFGGSYSDTETLHIAVGETDGIDSLPEIIVAYNLEDDVQGDYQLELRVFDVSKQTNGFRITHTATRSFHADAPQFGMAIGDTDRDSIKDGIITFYDHETSKLGVYVYDLRNHTDRVLAAEKYSWYSAAHAETPRGGWPLAVGTGDLDKDAWEDVVVAYTKTDFGARVLHLRDGSAAGGAPGLILAHTAEHHTYRMSDLSVSLLDENGDGLRGELGPVTGGQMDCASVSEPQILTVAYTPPFWQHIQGEQEGHSASVGEAKKNSHTEESGLTSTSSHSMSAYIGGGVDAKFLGVGVATTLKATAGYDIALAESQSGGSTSEREITEGWTGESGDALVIVERENYDCYNYQLVQSGAPIDGFTRLCQYKDRDQFAGDLEKWEQDDGRRTDVKSQATWAPVTRDWANLALFRGAFTQQSSIDNDGVPARAVDGNTDGIWNHDSVTHTRNESQPWWQVDLGKSHRLSKIRLWNREDDCCRQRLHDFYVFVSNSPFSSDDPAVLAASPNITTYRYPGYVKRVATFLTREGEQAELIWGRYIRVQLAGSGTLSLAEVQVFGANHVDPDRYPTRIISNFGCGAKVIPPNDGQYFEVELYNPANESYESVRVRGKLLWSGACDQVWENTIIGTGGATLGWSMSSSESKFTSVATSSEHAWRVGAEFDVEASVVASVVAGGAYEYTSGISEDWAKEISWGSGYEQAGSVQGFPPEYNTIPWAGGCSYGAVPFSYEVTEESAEGYVHRFTVLDYYVPNDKLNRRGQTAISLCRGPEEEPPVESALYLPLVDYSLGPVGLIPAGSVWKYLDDGSDQGAAWRNPGFDDGGWPAGPAQLGYGDGDEATVLSFGPNSEVKYITTYFRRTFNIADPNAITGLDLRLLRDDGAVVYLNGAEVFRDNMPSGAINYLTEANDFIAGADENAFIEATINRSLLVAGANVMAVEIHQDRPNSSDISFDLELIGWR